MKNGKIVYSFGFMLAVLVMAFPGTAKAACTNPAGDEGKVVYNSTHKTMQFCDDTNWISMKGGTDSVVWLDGGSGKRYYNGGNVGVATINPNYPFHVTGDLMVENNATDGSNIRLKNSATNIWSMDTTGATDSRLRIFSEGGATGNPERFTILENGNVGIGTASPGEKFSIGTAFNFHDGGSDVLAWSGDYTGSQWDRIGGAAYQGQISFTPSNGSFQIYSSNTDGNTAVFSNKFLTLVGTTGNVGIGTDNPGAKLDVAGTAEVNGQLDMVSNKIVNLATPTAAADAATKAYVDGVAGGGGVPQGTHCGLATGSGTSASVNCNAISSWSNRGTCQGVNLASSTSCPSGYSYRVYPTGASGSGFSTQVYCTRVCIKN